MKVETEIAFIDYLKGKIQIHASNSQFLEEA